MRHVKVRIVGKWGADTEAREVASGLLLRELSKPLRQAMECVCCHRAEKRGWMREDGEFLCRCCVHIEGKQVECHHKGANK